MLQLFLVALMVPLTQTSGANCASQFPNGTATKEHWWQCDDRRNAIVYDAIPQDINGNYEYPIYLDQPVKILAHINNMYGTAGDLAADFKIWEYSGILSCNWLELPTLGLLDNLDPCQHGTPCPIQAGNSTLVQMVDFSPFQAILNLLKDNAPYQVQVLIKDHSQSDTHILCLTVQVRARMHH